MGTVQSRSAVDASARRATFPLLSNIQIERLRSGKLDVMAGSTTLLATGAKVQPVARTRRHPINPDFERIAGLSADNEKRPRHRIRPDRDLFVPRIKTPRVDSLSHNGVAVIHRLNWIAQPNRIVEDFWLKEVA